MKYKYILIYTLYIILVGYGLFYDAVSTSDYITWKQDEELWNVKDMEVIFHGLIWGTLQNICLERLMNTTKPQPR
jgi:hypothetical protein